MLKIYVKKANQKLLALAHMSQKIDSIKLEILMSAFITVKFDCCPLLWMFHYRTMHSMLNALQETALRLC